MKKERKEKSKNNKYKNNKRKYDRLEKSIINAIKKYKM